MEKKLLLEDIINLNSLKKSCKKFKKNKPFDHCICKNFFKKNIAEKLENNFPNYKENSLHEYRNPIENKNSK